MTEREAGLLERAIKRDTPSLPVAVRQIGNGEWVCVLNASAMYIWDSRDWEANKSSAMIQAMRLIA